MIDPAQNHDDIIKWNHFPLYWPLCGEFTDSSPVTGEFPAQRPVRFGVFFDLRLNKRLRKQLRGWWFKTPCRSLWCHVNVTANPMTITSITVMSHERYGVKRIVRSICTRCLTNSEVVGDLRRDDAHITSLWCHEWPEAIWWRHQMETFSVSLVLCARNSPVTD